MSDAVSTTIRDHVAVIVIHRPPHNYFDPRVLTEVAQTLESLGPRSEGRAAVLCSEGKNFSAGADLNTSSILDSTERIYAVAARLAESAVPVVAAVQGSAVGGGFGLALIADFRVATPLTRFACNFAKLGFHQGFGISVTLPEVVGNQRALELLYTGRDVMGVEAHAIGLADRLAEPEDLRAVAVDLACDIAHSGPLAIAAIRETMRGSLGQRIRDATGNESRQQARLRSTSDFEEGVRAMAERRTPHFTGH